jgi:hypothetical protein
MMEKVATLLSTMIGKKAQIHNYSGKHRNDML